MVIELVLYEPGLDPGPPLLGVDLEHSVHVPGEVQDERAIDGLAGERGPAAPREERHLVLPRGLDSRLDVVRIAGDHDTDRLHLIHGRVGGVEKAGDRIEANVARDNLAKFVLEVVHTSYYSLRGRPPPRRPPAPAVLRLVARRRACGAGLQRAHPRQQARVRLARSDRQEGPGPTLPGVVVQAVRDRVGGAGARRGALPRARRRGPGTPRPGHHR